MIIIEKNEGQKVEYETNDTVISFGDGELSLNCANYQRDWSVHLDICSNRDGNLVIDTNSGLKYVAQLDIPAREYIYPDPVETDPDDEEDTSGGMNNESDPPIPVPLNMDNVTLSLWAIGE